MLRNCKGGVSNTRELILETWCNVLIEFSFFLENYITHSTHIVATWIYFNDKRSMLSFSIHCISGFDSCHYTSIVISFASEVLHFKRSQLSGIAA